MKINFLTVTILSTLPLTSSGYAQDAKTTTTDLLALSVGYYDVLDDQDGSDFRIEYRSKKTLLTDNLRPWAGLELTSQGSTWGGGGLLYDWKLAEKWHITPSIGAGLYTKGGSDIDLDAPIQFRTQLEISYEFKEKSRLGINLSHMSNAHLGNSNPGTEVISLLWATPINSIF